MSGASSTLVCLVSNDEDSSIDAVSQVKDLGVRVTLGVPHNPFLYDLHKTRVYESCCGVRANRRA